MRCEVGEVYEMWDVGWGRCMRCGMGEVYEMWGGGGV